MDALGDRHLLSRSGRLVHAAEVLKDKRVVIYYFSNLWEGDQLLKILDQVHDKSVECEIPVLIVYVSVDESESDFQESFFRRQPKWYALPYKDPTIYELIYRYQISHLPDCVAVNYDGDLVALCGAEQLKQKGVNVLVTWT